MATVRLWVGSAKTITAPPTFWPYHNRTITTKVGSVRFGSYLGSVRFGSVNNHENELFFYKSNSKRQIEKKNLWRKANENKKYY
jgi:hypothetical protein